MHEPDDTEPTILWNRAAGFAWRSGAYQEGQHFCERELEVRRRVLGEEHPHTLTAMANLATTLMHQGDWSGARSLHEQVLEVSRRVLGEDHPDTLMSMNNLATTLHDLGELETAEELKRTVVERCPTILGRHHPDTLATICNLMSTLEALGRSEELAEWGRRLARDAQGIELPPHHDVHAWLKKLGAEDASGESPAAEEI